MSKLPTPIEQWEEFKAQAPRALSEETENFMKMFYFGGMFAAVEFLQETAGMDPATIDRDQVYATWKDAVMAELMTTTEKLVVLGAKGETH
jgi:hypothetical protein